MLKIWSDQSYLRTLNDARPMLKPFWGQDEDKDDPDAGRFDKWLHDGPSTLQLVSLEEADVVIYPQDPTIDRDGFLRFQQVIGEKPLFVFFNSDLEDKLVVGTNCYVFRTSCQRSKKENNEYGLPAWSVDWGVRALRKWHDRPTVGFCGQHSIPPLRTQCLNTIGKDHRINANFLKQDCFWGGSFGKGPDKARNVRNEFIKNMENSDYVVCVRGGGNFSYRIYETMMSGRIPLFIDTDCLLPYDFMIDWNEYFPIIQQNELNNIGDTLLRFHNKISNSFEEHQQLMRKMWDTHISPTGFFSNIHKVMGT